jgi:hypothetical protein
LISADECDRGVDFNRFISDLEAESARRGMTQVRANRVVEGAAAPWPTAGR